jgi:hypothetical protein
VDAVVRVVRLARVDLRDGRVILNEVVGTGHEPDGLCADRSEHRAHLHESRTLGRFWCTADQSRREPWRSERRRAAQETR